MGSPTWASRKQRTLREARRREAPRLEPPGLAKGALRHCRPSSSPGAPKEEVLGPGSQIASELDFEAAEALGRKILGKDSWVKKIFEEFDGAAAGRKAK